MLNFKIDIFPPFVFIILIFGFEFSAFFNTEFTLWPEMVLYPWLFNHGFIPYKDIGMPYMPFFVWVLSLWTKAFGYGQTSYIFLTWGIILITEILFLIIYKKITSNNKNASFAFFIYAVLLIIFEGNGLWFDLFCAPWILLAYYFLLNKKYLIAGSFLAIGFLIKQTTVWAVVGSLFYLIFSNFSKVKLKYLIYDVCKFLFPIIISICFVVVAFYFQNAFADFYFWTIKMAFGGMQSHKEFIEFPTKRNIILMAIAFWPIIFVLKRKYIKNKVILLSLIYWLATYFFIFPRFGYFHLVSSLSFFAIIASNVLNSKIKKAVYLLPILALLLFILKNKYPFSVRFFSPKTYQKNSALDKFFMKKTLPKKPWIDVFPWYPKK